eukprot:jgi/Chrzof1/2820/Cz12g00020.t1
MVCVRYIWSSHVSGFCAWSCLHGPYDDEGICVDATYAFWCLLTQSVSRCTKLVSTAQGIMTAADHKVTFCSCVADIDGADDSEDDAPGPSSKRQKTGSTSYSLSKLNDRGGARTSKGSSKGEAEARWPIVRGGHSGQ